MKKILSVLLIFTFLISVGSAFDIGEQLGGKEKVKAIWLKDYGTSPTEGWIAYGVGKDVYQYWDNDNERLTVIGTPTNGLYFDVQDIRFYSDDTTNDTLIIDMPVTVSSTIGFSDDITIAANKSITYAEGTGTFDASLATGIFKSSTGTNTLGGNTVIAGAKTFGTGTGAVTINGDTSLAENVEVACVAGTTALDLSLGTGVTKTTSGINTFGGDVSIASGKDFDMVGDGTFGTGSGAVSLEGDVTISEDKDLGMSGTATFATGTGAITLSGPVGITAGVDITAAGTGSNIDYSASTDGTFTSPGGANTLGGNVAISGSKTFGTGTGKTTINGDIDLAASSDMVVIAGDSKVDFGVGTGIFRSTTGANTLMGDVTITGAKKLTTGTGAVSLDGPVSIGTGIDVTADGAGCDLDYVLSDGFFKSPTGTNTLGGNVVISGSKTLTTGTGKTIINGDIDLAASSDLVVVAGDSKVDFGVGTGIFRSTTGTNTLMGDTSIAGAKTFSTGTGAVSLDGEISIGTGISMTADGAGCNFDYSASDGTFKTPTGAATLGGATSCSSSLGVTGATTLDGAVTTPITVLNATSYDVLVTDYIIAVDYTDTDVCTVTIPTAQMLTGRTLIIKDTGFNAATKTITIATEGAEQIDEAATATITGNGDSLTIVAGAAEWFIV